MHRIHLPSNLASTLAITLSLALAGTTSAQQAADTVAPESPAATTTASDNMAIAAALKAKADGQPVTAQDWMIAAANPLAAEAGAKILARGGSAADAMIAVQTVLGLVEPQSSGLGGGAFLVYWDNARKRLTTLDGRETAPLRATPTLFLDDQGEPLKFYDAVVGGLSVGTPGTPALMERAYKYWGTLPWPDLFQDAITLATEGFDVSPRLAGLVAEDTDHLSHFPATAAYFLPDGEPIQAGDTLTNLPYALTLRLLSANGSRAFYTGKMADQIVQTVQTAPGNPGVLSQADLALYQVVERPAVCGPYRVYEVCGMGPPSSGALTVAQILGMLDTYDLGAMGADDPQAWRLIGDASRLAFADRGRYMADSDYVPVPVKGLLSPDYLARRAELLEADTALKTIAPGEPEFDHAMLWADDQSIEFPSTSHISIVDSAGNVLSVTTTIENGFGSRLMVGGFLLNNELTDFSFRTHSDGHPIANRVEPGKRPRSSMAPTIVMKDGAPVLAVGSPGGSRIIGYVAQTVIAWADWGMNIQQAIALPHAVNRFGTYDVETDAQVEGLTALGYEVEQKALNSGIHAIEIGEVLKGGADPRREGIALGE
ncbi:Gamma-glutamyltranspeptidase precursor [Marinibacterium anthonyi]|nr:Gamma-glutamyltranspeptidase precursor [Marinibacterium anthonyi]